MFGPDRSHTGPLTDFYRRGHAVAADCDPDFQQLWRGLEATSSGGKRFRPRLVRAAYEGLGGTEPHVAEHVGEAIELLHNALLLHDDVIDRDETRRGAPNVPGTFARRAATAGADAHGAETLGTAAGILAGDLALVGATRMIALTPVAPPVVHRLLELFERTVCVTAAGELADVRFSLDLEPHSLGDTLTMEERKTAVYSFVLPLQAGAVCAGAPEEVVAGLSDYGRLLGVAFQLVDDLLGVFGDPRESGKSTLTDLREGKLTPLISHARTTAAWPQIAPGFGDPELGEARAAHLRRVLDECGSRRFVEDLASDYRAAARDVVASLPLPDDLVGSLTELTEGLTRRVA